MELNVWAKSFFSIYRCLDKLASSIDKFVQIKAFASCQNSLSSVSFCGTEKVTADLTELINKKINLINIKLLTEKVLKILPPKFARFIIMKYMEDKTFDEIAFKMNICVRTTLRWNILAMEKSGKILESLGFNDKKLQDLIGSENWIRKIAYLLASEEEIKHQPKLTYSYIVRLAEKEYSYFSF